MKTQFAHTRAWIEVVFGVLLMAASVVITLMTFQEGQEAGGGHYVVAFGPFVAGASLAMHGVFDLSGYRSFVALRYLLVAQPKVTKLTRQALAVAIVVRILWGFASGHGLTATILALQSPFASLSNVITVVTSGAIAVIVFWGVLRHSKAAMVVFLIGFGLGILSMLAARVVAANAIPFVTLEMELQISILRVLTVTMLVGFGLAGLAQFFGCLRAFFTFFTTVPIGGVWIGTAALVCVLAVMSGFETDLRDKILGSNAHIQITREDGEFTDWRAVKERIDKIPGVVASTPYAVSEVVIAAHNNGMNVIIKGIDPATVGKVTDLISDLEDPEAIKRMEPLVDDSRDLTVPQQTKPPPADVLDPPPDDMVTGGEPIDFSGVPSDDDATPDTEPDAIPDAKSGTKPGTKSNAKPDAKPGANPDAKPDVGPVTKPDTGATTPDPGSATKADSGSAAKPDPGANSAGPMLEPPPDYGGDAPAITGTKDDEPVLDPPPSDMITLDEPPVDYSAPDAIDFDDLPIDAIDIPIEPTLSRRTQSLPGVLVGRELVKQTHLYTGEEVRVVSPLSDPSNPDATGTPIPFNRDYRVAGIFYTGMYEYDLKYVYVTLDSLQDFLDRGDAIDGIEVRISNADDTGSYVPTDAGPGLIRQALGPGYRVVDWRELNRSLFSALKLEKIAMFLVLGIVILVASFSIVGNLIMVVVEKAREIALLKTLGASNVGVMQLFSIQGLMIGMIGTALGVATGLLACWAGKRFGLPLNPDVYYIDRLPIHVDPQSVAAAAAAGILISIAATLYPALLAARVRPAAGMRH